MEIIILFLIISAISKLISGNKEQQQKQQQQQQRPQQQQQRSQRSQQPQRPVSRPNVGVPKPTPTPSGGHRSTVNSPEIQTMTIEEQHKQQMDQLASQMNTKANYSFSEVTNEYSGLNTLMNREQNKTELTERQEIFKKRMKSNINRKGLVDSVIMAEVLGPPKALKPYRSVVAERDKA